MIIHNEKLASHEVRVKILEACQTPKTMSELKAIFNQSKPYLHNHLYQLMQHELLLSHKPSSKEPARYTALAKDYDWKEPDPTFSGPFRKVLHGNVNNYGKGGIYLMADRPASLEKHPLRKLPKNTVGGSTLSAYDY